MPRYTPSGRKTAVADVEDKLKAEYPGNPGAVYGTLNKAGLMRGNQATAKGRSPAKFKEHRRRGAVAVLIALGLMAGSAVAASSPQDNLFNTAKPTAPVVSSALESNHVLKSSAGILRGFQANIVTCATAPCWVLVFDATSLPGDGAVTPKKWYQVIQNQTLAVGYSPPLSMATGITLGCSTSGPFTLAATVQCTFSGEVE